MTMPLRVMTYNIHKGIGGLDRRYRLERVVQTMLHYKPDLLLLQEVTDGVPRARLDRQVEMLASALELPHHVFQPNVRLRIGEYGNAILSRFPLTHMRDIDLTVRMKKRRRSLVAHCHVRNETHTRTVVVFNFHLGLAGFERAIQIRRFLSDDALNRTHKSTPIIAAGDFNDVWGTLGRRLLEPAGFTPAAGLMKTFPAFRPVRPLDRIYFRGDMDVVQCYPSRTRVARLASDHLPIIAEFELRAAWLQRVAE